MSDNQTYEEHVQEALDCVKTGTHLRHINLAYRTKEVCLAAVCYESTHTDTLNDFYAVPPDELFYVMENMREIKKDDPCYLNELERAYLDRTVPTCSCVIF